MSNPKVYGFCDAGCRRRVPNYDEFLASAYKVKKAIDADGYAQLVVGETVIARSRDYKSNTSWDLTIGIGILENGSISSFENYSISTTVDKYADGAKIRFLDCIKHYSEEGFLMFKALIEINGERVEFLSRFANNSESTIFDVRVAIGLLAECYHINEASKILVEGKDGKDGETPYIGENGNWWIGNTDTLVCANSKNEEFERRLIQLEAHIDPKYYISEESMAYERVIPSNACPFIELDSIGGNFVQVPNEKSKNILNPAIFNMAVTADGGIYMQNSGEDQYLQASIYLPTSDYYTISAIDDKGQIVQSSFETQGGYSTIPGGENIDIWVWGWDTDSTVYVMIEKGESATAFESFYTKKPAKVTAVEIYGANLLPFPYYSGSTTINGVNFIVNSDGTLTLNGTNTGTGNATFQMFMNYSFSLEAGTYTMKGTGNANVVFRISDGVEARDASTFNLTFTISKKTNFNVFVYVKANTTLTNFVVKPMFNKGNNAVPYSPYSAKPISTYNISTYFQNLDGYGYGIEGYSNAIDFDNKKFIKRVEKLAFNGSENWEYYGWNAPENNYFYLTIGEAGTVVNNAITCNVYATNVISGSNTNSGIYIVNSSSGEARIVFRPRGYENMTVEDLKAHLAERSVNGNPVTIVYALVEQVVTDISAELSDFDNTFEVEAGGILKFINEEKAAIPSTISYLAKEGSV